MIAKQILYICTYINRLLCIYIYILYIHTYAKDSFGLAAFSISNFLFILYKQIQYRLHIFYII